MKTITKFTVAKLFSLIILGLLISSSTLVKNTENSIAFEDAYDNSIWTELMKDLNSGKCYKMEATSNNVKKKSSSEEHAFTTFGQADVKKVNSSTIEMKNVKTYFSDRGLFRGRTTKESFTISCTSRAFTVKIKQHDWGNRTETLRDATIFRGANGFFISGNYYNGRKLTFVTIALYKQKCSGLI
ncbi:hypothetical protein [Spongiivirga citrea]|uniref:Uncharacterized protein n=1 Tax=Spongiivirga citrea TaxID=1481457 RepID=A0A6M0CL87_9FLAO|nr:hypothetical protein [Spongiivirga citrea]NER18696.1 hypothetical protein [Spongiivirga citrea]